MAERTDSTKRKWRVWKILLVLFLIWFFNNYSLKITRTSMESSKITEPVRIAVLSDLHAHKGSISNSRIMRKIDNISPDAVFVLGDMYSRGSDEEKIGIAVEFISDVAEKYPTYFVSGDHDTSAVYFENLKNSGVHVMNYSYEYAEIKGTQFQIMGIDNVYYSSTFDLNNAFVLDESCFSILLAHIPNYRGFSEFGADLTLSADTHGGMVRLPLMGALFDPLTKTYFPKLRGVKAYDKGWFEYDGGNLFITSGIGDSPYPVRFCNLPEVVSIDLVPESNS